jgi:hypothetical protein
VFIHSYPPSGRRGASRSSNFGIACEHPLIPDFRTTTTITI